MRPDGRHDQLPSRFDPRTIGFIEARLWHAYYARHWPRVGLLTYRLVRGQLGLRPWPALIATGHVARAARAWAPLQNDPETTRRELRRFYRVVARTTGAPFDADAAGDAEFDYWRIHRDMVGHPRREPLIAALARIPATLYEAPVEAMLTSATERERAVRLVDDIILGRRRSTEAAWREIATALIRSYLLLAETVASLGAGRHDAEAESGRTIGVPQATGASGKPAGMPLAERDGGVSR